MILRRAELAAAIVTGCLLACAPSVRAQSQSTMPDWSGQWEIVGAVPSASGGFEQSLDEVLKTMQWGAPNRPETQSTVDQQNAEYRKYFDAAYHGTYLGGEPGVTCTFGFPTVMLDSPLMFEILSTPKETVLIFSGREVRHVYTDGRSHTPKDELWATPWGDSIGHWEGQTLVIDTIAIDSPSGTGFPTDVVPIFALGGDVAEGVLITVLSSQAHYIERIRMIDPGHLEDRMTVIDPANLTRPWHVKRVYERVAHINRMVYEDCEGEDRNPLVDGRFTLAPAPSSPAPAPPPSQGQTK